MIWAVNGTGLPVFKRLPLFKDPLLVHVRVVRNRPVRVPTYLTNFRDRVASFHKGRNARVLGLMETHAVEPLAFGLLIDGLPKRRQRLPPIEHAPCLLPLPHR